MGNELAQMFQSIYNTTNAKQDAVNQKEVYKADLDFRNKQAEESRASREREIAEQRYENQKGRELQWNIALLNARRASAGSHKETPVNVGSGVVGVTSEKFEFNSPDEVKNVDVAGKKPEKVYNPVEDRHQDLIKTLNDSKTFATVVNEGGSVTLDFSKIDLGTDKIKAKDGTLYVALPERFQEIPSDEEGRKHLAGELPAGSHVVTLKNGDEAMRYLKLDKKMLLSLTHTFFDAKKSVSQGEANRISRVRSNVVEPIFNLLQNNGVKLLHMDKQTRRSAISKAESLDKIATDIKSNKDKVKKLTDFKDKVSDLGAVVKAKSTSGGSLSRTLGNVANFFGSDSAITKVFGKLVAGRNLTPEEAKLYAGAEKKIQSLTIDVLKELSGNDNVGSLFKGTEADLVKMFWTTGIISSNGKINLSENNLAVFNSTMDDLIDRRVKKIENDINYVGHNWNLYKLSGHPIMQTLSGILTKNKDTNQIELNKNLSSIIYPAPRISQVPASPPPASPFIAEPRVSNPVRVESGDLTDVSNNKDLQNKEGVGQTGITHIKRGSPVKIGSLADDLNS